MSGSKIRTLKRSYQTATAAAFAVAMGCSHQGQLASSAPSTTPQSAVAQGSEAESPETRRIDLDLNEVEIRSVFAMMAQLGEVEINVDENVGGTVTATMRQIPWNQALAAFLDAKGLGMVRHDNVIRIASLDTLRDE